MSLELIFFFVVVLLLLALLWLLLDLRKKNVGTSFLADLSGLVAKGVLAERHVVEYVEAHIAWKKADVALCAAHAKTQSLAAGTLEAAPVALTPGFTAPAVDQPVVDQPVVEQSVVEQPVVEQSVVEQPVVEQSSSQPVNA